MTAPIEREKAYIYRIVHRPNLADIFERGSCRCRTLADKPGGYSEIGNQELIARRNHRPVPVAPGGTLGDYVPFYFTPYSPMLLNIKTGWGVPQKPMSEIVILVSSIPRLIEQELAFVFTDRHAYLRTALFSNNPKDLDWIIWDVLKQRDFKRDDSDKVEKYQAESLVHKKVPLEALHGIICYDELVKSEVEQEAKCFSRHVKVAAKPTWYL